MSDIKKVIEESQGQKGILTSIMTDNFGQSGLLLHKTNREKAHNSKYRHNLKQGTRSTYEEQVISTDTEDRNLPKACGNPLLHYEDTSNYLRIACCFGDCVSETEIHVQAKQGWGRAR